MRLFCFLSVNFLIVETSMVVFHVFTVLFKSQGVCSFELSLSYYGAAKKIGYITVFTYTGSCCEFHKSFVTIFAIVLFTVYIFIIDILNITTKNKRNVTKEQKLQK